MGTHRGLRVFRKEHVRDVVDLLRRDDSHSIADILEHALDHPSPQPARHNSPGRFKWIGIDIPIESAEQIVELLGCEEARLVSSDGESTGRASHYGALLDRWLEYTRWRNEDDA